MAAGRTEVTATSCLPGDQIPHDQLTVCIVILTGRQHPVCQVAVPCAQQNTHTHHITIDYTFSLLTCWFSLNLDNTIYFEWWHMDDESEALR